MSLLGRALRNEVLVGAIFVLSLGLAVFISYNASRGLPFLASYRISVDVPDAQELVTSDQARIGGARVGLVSRVRAMPAEGNEKPFARIDLTLDPDLDPLPADTRVQVRPGSILGGKYLAIYPGHSSRGIPNGGILPLRQAKPVTDLDEAFRIFDRQTAQGIRTTVGELGTGVSGRGTAIDEAIGSLHRALPPLERVLRVVVDPRTNLRGFVSGAAQTFGALAPVAPQLAALLDSGATTLAALNEAGGALGQAIEETPPTEVEATRTLVSLSPVLDDAAATVRALRPGARLLPRTSARLATALELGTKALGERTHGQLDPLFASFDRLARDPASVGTIETLRSSVTSLRPTLDLLGPAQLACNSLGEFARNVPSTISEGDTAGTWVRLVPILGTPQMFQAPAPDSDLHLNFYPRETAGDCEGGNEPYSPGQAIGNPPGSQGNTADVTRAPATARERAAAAGLLSTGAGGP
jgi:virulence factor Mce-like protein